MAASKKPKLSKTPQWGSRSPKGYVAKFGFFEAAILYICGHIPTNAYAILAAIFQQEFKHPKFKHPNGIPEIHLHQFGWFYTECLNGLMTFYNICSKQCLK